ncbi:MAG: phosphatidylglycerophosphatase A [Bdellovibrionales bacterium]
MRPLFTALATGLYVGKSPYFPGTCGTLLAVPLVWILNELGPLSYLLLTFASIVGAIYVAEIYEAYHKTHDQSEVVIDEIVGFFLTMALIPLTVKTLVAGFVLFRILDMVKPFPISYFDKNIKGGYGVVFDDLFAGLLANLILQYIVLRTLWLGDF